MKRTKSLPQHFIHLLIIFLILLQTENFHLFENFQNLRCAAFDVIFFFFFDVILFPTFLIWDINTKAEIVSGGD